MTEILAGYTIMWILVSTSVIPGEMPSTMVGELPMSQVECEKMAAEMPTIIEPDKSFFVIQKCHRIQIPPVQQ